MHRNYWTTWSYVCIQIPLKQLFCGSRMNTFTVDFGVFTVVSETLVRFWFGVGFQRLKWSLFEDLLQHMSLSPKLHSKAKLWAHNPQQHAFNCPLPMRSLNGRYRLSRSKLSCSCVVTYVLQLFSGSTYNIIDRKLAVKPSLTLTHLGLGFVSDEWIAYL